MSCVPKFHWNPEINAEWQQLESRIERFENEVREFLTLLRLRRPVVTRRISRFLRPPSDLNPDVDETHQLTPIPSQNGGFVASSQTLMGARPAEAEEEPWNDKYGFEETLRMKKAVATQEQERRSEIKDIRRAAGVCEQCGKGLDNFARLLRKSSHLECSAFQETSGSDSDSSKFVAAH